MRLAAAAAAAPVGIGVEAQAGPQIAFLRQFNES